MVVWIYGWDRVIVGFKGGLQLWVWLIQAIHTATRCMGFPVFPKLTLSSSIDGGVCLFTGSQVGLGVTCFFAYYRIGHCL